MNHKNMQPEKQLIVTRLVLKAGKSMSKQMAMSLQANQAVIDSKPGGNFIMKIPYLKRLFSQQKKVRYFLPKGGVPILAGPDVINRVTAMARMRKMSHFSI